MNFKSLRIAIPAILIIITFVVSFNIFLKRLQYDLNRNTVEFAINEKDISFLQHLSGNDFTKMLAILKEQVGITSVVVPEYTIDDYISLSKVSVIAGYEIINNLRVGRSASTVLSRLRRKTRIEPDSTYIIVDEKKIYKRIVSHLKLMLPNSSVVEHSGNIIQVNLSLNKVKEIPLGFNEDLLTSYNAFGFNIIPELGNYNHLSKSKIEYIFSEIDGLDSVKTIMFSESFNYGINSYQTDFKELIKKYNFLVAYPEFDSSKSLQKIITKVPNQVISAHKIFHYNTFNSFDILYHRYMRAINERSVNLLIFSTLDLSKINGLYDQNILLFKRVIDTYKRVGGSQVEYMASIDNINVSFLEKAFIGLGLFALIYMSFMKVHLLSSFKENLYLILILITLYAITISISSLTVQILGFISAVIGPVFAIIYFFPPNNMKFISIWDKLFNLIQFLVKVFVVCIFSVICCISLYSDPLFLHNIIPFKGVKLSLLLPVILVGTYFFCGPNRVNSFYYIMRRLLRLPLTASMLMVFAVIVLILFVYLFRSGNYFQTFGFEIAIRNYLEQVFIVRPRFKEILIGYPALLLGFWYLDRSFNRQFLWLFNGLGVIALSSLINSFCHFHTPVLISFYRSIIGFFFGLVIAVFIYFICYFLIKFARSASFIIK